MEVNIYIGFETLKMKCTQYGICGQVAFKNASTLVFSKSGGRATIFGRVQEKGRGLPPDKIFPPKSSWGALNVLQHKPWGEFELYKLGIKSMFWIWFEWM